jgi:hypothetical protein
MSFRHTVPAIALVVAAVAAAVFITDPRASADTLKRKPGEGVICAWSVYTIASEVGGRCYPGQHFEVQAELRRAVSLLDAYVIANTKPPATQQLVDDFKRKQGHVGASTEFLCRGDPDQLYRAFVQQGASAIRNAVDDLVSRPGQPTWGTCL